MENWEGKMKKIILLGLFSIFFVACSSNQKVLQNTTTILRGESIKVAEHIYGTAQTLPYRLYGYPNTDQAR